ncbi:MAG: sigma-70 family RNA polymerase sigma factor [Treponema sp.]|nr:sigma-70 family RNA polymerase sigma factor [Treponema sp.]
MLRNEEDALDAAQDVFVKLLRYHKRLHGRFLSSLFYTIATNICLNRLRQQKWQGGSFYDNEALFPAAHDPEFERVEAGMVMDAIFHSESESTRAICYMYHGDGMTLREIGELMGLSVSGVRKRLLAFNARVKHKWEGERL